MSRYIDADLLKQTVQDNITRYFTCGTGGYCLAEDVVEDIDAFPTADVVEVRHGEWETTPDYKPNTLIAYYHICSVCKTTYKDIRPHGHKYCHECGAKMDGERKEENEG